MIVVAEGAGEELLGKSLVLDASGNRRPPPIGVSTQVTYKINTVLFITLSTFST